MTRLLSTRSVRTQLVFSFIVLVFLEAIAISVPVLWLIRSHLNHQAWAQIEQGTQAAQAIYAIELTRLNDLAALTAQRPTLEALLAQNDQAVLRGYLRQLQDSSGFDLVSICIEGQEVSSYAVVSITQSICSASTSNHYAAVRGSSYSSQPWLLGNHPLPDEISHSGYVVIGQLLDDVFASQMRDQTGLEHSLWDDNQLLSTSLTDDRTAISDALHEPVESDNLADIGKWIFTIDGHRYYAARIPLDGAGLEAEVILPIGDIIATQRRLIGFLTSGILGAAVIASSLGTLLARRLSRPLIHLADSASEMSTGNLDHEIVVGAPIPEVVRVAQALEHARVDLKQILLRLQQEKNWADHLLASIVEGIMTLDATRCISYFSSGAERITGWQRNKVLLRPVDDIFKLVDEDTPFSQQIPQQGQRAKLTVNLAHGQQATLAITRALLAPSEAIEASEVLVFRDISEEEAIHRLLGHFMGSVAHEFKTPLAALAASVELLLDQAPDLSPEELSELLISLHLGIVGLQTLVDNLLESANIEAQRFHVSPRSYDLGIVISEAVQMMEPLLRKYGQRLIIELPASLRPVQADPRRTVQVLVNLLSNASKYGPPDADISISVLSHDKYVRVQVADQGAGIPTDFRQQVFKRFVHPDIAGEHEKAGAGLGLSVVKAIVETQGGQVGIEDRAGGGAVFWFTIPLDSERV
ncbi:MAG: HAMP domain-containing protein [Anaerolineae bacterium]|nr:HAMP domain-containing protein [Anaerolineae bacterium]